MKGRYLFCFGIYPQHSRERRTAVGTNCSSLRKVFISTCHTWLPDVLKKGWEEGGKGMWRMGYILKPNNLSFVFRSIVLGRGRMGRGKNPVCFFDAASSYSLNGIPCVAASSKGGRSPQSWPSKEGLMHLFIYLKAVSELLFHCTQLKVFGYPNW